MEKEEYVQECKKILEYFHKDLSKDEITCHDGDYGCIMNPNSEFYETFGGYSIYGIACFYAKETGKRIKFID